MDLVYKKGLQCLKSRWHMSLHIALYGPFTKLHFGICAIYFHLKVYSYYPLSPNIIGSIFYLTTGLHGLHVSSCFLCIFHWRGTKLGHESCLVS